ncbi:MAG: hypothetical protein VKL39_02395 [Leptolyngbyaceae bacterium]|nr:hypothetical protein [Leptolyngbyaceae bacterium]
MVTLNSSLVRIIPFAMGASLTSLGFTAALPNPALGEPLLGDRLLLAQQVVDGLPPPPSFPVADGANFPSASGSGDVGVQSSGTSADQLFMVAVNGNSPLLLEQVRQVQPTALIQEYNGQPIILVGAYESAAQAQEQATALARSGISASITPVPSSIFEPVPMENEGFAGIPELPPADFNDPSATPPSQPVATQFPAPDFSQTQAAQPAPAPREIEFSPVPSNVPPTVAAQPVPTVQSPTVQSPTTFPSDQPPSVSTADDLADNAYYIVIPGDAASLDTVREQVVLLGGRYDVVMKRERPLGPHILVGPFTDRQAASRWNGFLRDFGMNARVYYRR